MVFLIITPLVSSIGFGSDFSTPRPTASITNPSTENPLSVFLESLDRFIPFVHDQLHDLPSSDEKQLFENLASLQKQIDRETAKQSLPSIAGTALFTETGAWSAWSGVIEDLPGNWMEYIATSESGAGIVVLYETPAKAIIVHLTKGDYRIAMTQIILIDRSIDGIQPDGMMIQGKHNHYLFRYLSPFDRLPGVMPLSSNLSESILPDILLPIEDIAAKQSFFGNECLPEWLRPLFDPHFFAGNFLGLHSAGMLLVAGLIAWSLTHRLVTFQPNRHRKKLLVVFTAFSSLATIFFVSRLAHSLISDTSFAWWPEFPIEYSLATLALPLSALLLAGAWMRWIFFLLLSLIQSRSRSDSPFKKHHIPGWLCQISAIALLSPYLISLSGATIRQNISSRLQNWINERERLLPLALENNLDILSADEMLYHWEDGAPFSNTAFHLWRKSDLHVFEADFAVQILDENGVILQQFSPFFTPDTLHPEILDQSLAVDTGRLIIPPRLHHHSIHSPLIGITAVETDDDMFVYLVIQIAMEPGAIKPPPHRWGDAITVHVARREDSSELHRDIPAVLQAEWFEHPPSEPKWIDDESGRFQALLFRLPYSDPTQPEILVGLLPRISFESHLAGIARLALLSMCLLMPGLAYFEIKHIVRSRKEKTYGSFTRQLLGAFLLPVIALPLIFAVTLHRVIDDSETEFQKEQMAQMLQQTLMQLKEHTIEQAKILRSNVEHHFFNEYDPDFSGVMGGTWLVLDEFGRETMSGATPSIHDLPLETISRVFQETYYRGRAADEIVFQSRSPGELTAQVILAFPQFPAMNSNDEVFQGTFVCEIPITDDACRSLDEFSDSLIAIYSQGSISASNRPELFQTGLISNRLDASLYRSLVFQKRDTLLKFDRTHGQYSVTGAFYSEFSHVIGAATMSFTRFPFTAQHSKANEWLFPTTLFLLVSGILFSLYFGRRIARPVKALTESALEVSKGNFNVIVPEHGAGEIRLLTRTFNIMTRDLEVQRIDLQERYTFINALLARMSSAILAVDNTGNILTWNEAFQNLFPTSGIDGENHKIDRVFMDIGIPELKMIFDGYVSGSVEDRHVFRFFREGRIVHLAVTFAKLQFPGRLTGILIVMDDITDTVQSSKLQAYSEMARRIAHEVKNPLTPIQLSIEHLRQAWEDGAADFPAIFNQCLSMVLEEVRSLERISTEFSRFARFPKPSFQLDDMRHVINEVAAMYPAALTGTTFQVDLPDDPLLCRYDHDQIKRVLINLVQNALQAMDNKGVLKLKGSRDGNWIKIEIVDTGPGMDKETLMNLFEPYFSTKKEGAGLGLVITKAVIEAHEGIIQVQSAPGEGTSFIFRLAAADSITPIREEKGGFNAE